MQRLLFYPVLFNIGICSENCECKQIDNNFAISHLCNITNQIIAVKEKVKDKTKKNSSSLKLVRQTFLKDDDEDDDEDDNFKKEITGVSLKLMRSILRSLCLWLLIC